MRAFKTLSLCNDTNQGFCSSGWALRLGKRVKKALVLCVALCVLSCEQAVAAELPNYDSVSDGDYAIMPLFYEAADYFEVTFDFNGYEHTAMIDTTYEYWVVFIQDNIAVYVACSRSPIMVCEKDGAFYFCGSGESSLDVYDDCGDLCYQVDFLDCEMCSHGNYMYSESIDSVEMGKYVYCTDVVSNGSDSMIGSASTNNTVDSVIYESYEEFMESPLYVTRYENEVLNKLEFIQYALAIVIAALFLLIFKKK